MRLLFERLPSSSSAKILTSKEVVSLNQTESGVRVMCTDDSFYEGDIVIGADGVRSAVRTLMLDSSGTGLTAQPSFLASQEPVPHMPEGYSSTFQCIFGCSPKPEALPTGEMTDTQDGALAWQLLTTADLVVWFFYIRTDRTKTIWGNHSDEEMCFLAEKYLYHPVSENGAINFGDLWRTRKRAKLVDLEEGVLDKWHYGGRVVLVGDSAHKMTSNLALGANNAMESAASLVNHLHALMQTGGSRSPDVTRLEAAFAAYQRERHGRAVWNVRYCGAMLRYAGWLNGLLRVVCRFMTINSGDRFVADVVLPWISRDCVVLNFVEEKHYRVGKIPWAEAGDGTKQA